MREVARAPALSTPRSEQAWIWSARTDLLAFGGSALVALTLCALAGPLSDPDHALPAWGWLLLVVGVDVTHVWTTLYRTYLDGDEVRRRKALYIAVPIACWLFGVALHLVSHLAFWRTLAYLAVFHFVRQQVGWVAIYRARSGDRSAIGRWLDEAVVYLATGWPLLYWHAHLPRAFRWFVEGDFADLRALAPLVTPVLALYLTVLVAYAARAVARAARGRLDVGKHLVVLTTAATWYVGIVATNSDFQFTAANVIVHGVPYMALLWAYTRERGEEAPRAMVGRVARAGVAVFFGACLVLAFTEELLWDRLVWHDRPLLFGGRGEPLLGGWARALVVPLLAVPQATHYLLDALLWRRRDTGPAQARALGFLAPAALSGRGIATPDPAGRSAPRRRRCRTPRRRATRPHRARRPGRSGRR